MGEHFHCVAIEVVEQKELDRTLLQFDIEGEPDKRGKVKFIRFFIDSQEFFKILKK